MSLRNVLMDDARAAQVSLAERLREDETIELSTAGGGTAAPADATYVVMSLNAVLTNERTLAVTSPLTLTDAGAGGNATIALDVAGAVLYDHWEFDGAAWVIVSDPNIADDNFLYFGNDQDVSMKYDEAGANIFSVTGAPWLINGPIVNIGTAEGGGGELLALRVDQDTITAMEIVNANGGNSAAANLRIKNTAGAGANDALALGVTGTGWNTIGLAVADMGVVQANANLSGGMLLRVNHATAALICAVNSDDERWRVDTTGMVVNEPGTNIDFRVESDNQTHMLFVDGGNNVMGIRSSTPASVAEGLHVPWIAGDADDTAYFGSTNVSNDQVAIRAESYSNNGLMCTTVTGHALVADSTGSGDIAEFRNSGAIRWYVTSGGNFKAVNSSTLDLSGGADALILDAAGNVTISAPAPNQMDFEVGGADRFVITNTYANFVTGPLFINETANANMTIGLTIDQAANNDEALNIRNSDVGAVWSGVETGTYLTVDKANDDGGGARIRGFRDADGTPREAISLRGYLAENPSVAKTTSATAIVEIHGYETDGTDIVDTVADGNVWALRTMRSSSVVTLVVIDEDADMNLPSGRIATGHGDYWDIEDYHAGAPTADGYVRVDINGTTYELLANLP